jgi:hypothetical protein
MQGTTTITFDLLQLFAAVGGLLSAFAAVVVAFGRMLIKGFERRLDERFQARDASLADMKKQLDRVEQHGKDLERDVLRLQADLPKEYVRREDWIRLSTMIDAKLDWLRDKVEATSQTLSAIAERMKPKRDRE